MKRAKRALAAALCLCMCCGWISPAAYAEMAHTAQQALVTAEAEEVITSEVTAEPTAEPTAAPEATAESTVAPLSDDTVVASGLCGAGVTWTLTGDGTLTISGSGSMNSYDQNTIYQPWYDYGSQVYKIVVEDGVTIIGDYAFHCCTNAEEITLGNTVSWIGKRALAGNYTELHLPASVTKIGYNALTYCRQLQGIWVDEANENYSSDDRGVLYNKAQTHLIRVPGKLTGAYAAPDTLLTVDEWAFYYCDQMTALTIGDGVTSLGSIALWGCSQLETLTLGDGITALGSLFSNSVGLDSLRVVNLGSGATVDTETGFDEVPTLEQINVAADNPNYCSIEGVVYTKDKTGLVVCPPGKAGAYTVPDGVVTLGSGAFSRCVGLTEITLPVSLTTVGSSAFYGCSGLTELVLPAAVTTIGSSAFADSTGLTALQLQDTQVAGLRMNLVSGCTALQTITLPQTVENIGEYCFRNCTALAQITIPASVSFIDNYAFQNCTGLQTVTFAGGYPASGIYSTAFTGVSATCAYPDNRLTWSSSTMLNYGGTLVWEAYEVNEFEGEEFTYTLPDTAITLAYRLNAAEDGVAVTQCNTDAVGVLEIPAQINGYAVKAIGDNAFENCTGLTEVVIPDSVTEIGEAAFKSCSGLKTVTIPASVTQIPAYAFQGCGITALDLPESIIAIGDYAFYGLKATTLTLPEGLTTVGEYAFQNGRMTSVVLPDSLTYIPDGMFKSCNYLVDVDFPAQITGIGASAFASCYSLGSVVLPEGLVTIGSEAFSNCGNSVSFGSYYDADNFTSVTLPSTVESIGDYAFFWCTSLTSVSLPNGLKAIPSECFSQCRKLTSIQIPAAIESIGSGAFWQCMQLKNVTFRWGAPTIASAFGGGLTLTAYYPGNNAAWTSDMLQNYGADQITWVSQEMEAYAPGVGGSGNAGEEEDGGDDSGNTGTGGTTGGDTGAGGNTGTEGGTTGGNTGTEGGNTGSGGSESGGGQTAQFAIVEQPTNQTALLGETATFGLSASGSVLIYQWQYSTDAGQSWTNCTETGAESNTLTLTAGCAVDGTLYRCAVTETDTDSTLISESACLTVTLPEGATTGGIGTDGLIWLLGQDGTLTISGEGAMASYTAGTAPWYTLRDDITAIVVEDGITAVKNHAFYQCAAAQSVTLAESVASVGYQSFYGCSQLQQVDLPDGLTSIGYGAFRYCSSLTDITIPDTVTSIDSYAFADTALAAITLPEGLATINIYTFYLCQKLTELHIPTSVTIINHYALSGCGALTDVYYAGSAAQWDEIEIGAGNTPLTDAVLHTVEPNIAQGTCGDNLTWVLDHDGTLTISGTGAMADYTAETAPWYSYASQITAVVMGDGVTNVGDYAFYKCTAVKSLTLSDSVTTIGDYAFYNCYLTELELPAGVNSIGAYAFYCLRAASLTLPENLIEVGEYAFQSSRMTSVVLPDSLTYIPDGMFNGCYYLVDVDFPAQITSIGVSAFDGCYGLGSVVLPEGLAAIGERAFAGCGNSVSYGSYYDANNFTSVTLPSTVESIGEYAFFWCTSLTSVTLPDTLKVIPEGCFSQCRKLTSVQIPSDIESIGYDAFLQCLALKKVTFGWNVPIISTGTFGGGMTLTAYYPGNNPAWTVDVRQNYGGTVTWVPYCLDDVHSYEAVVTAPTCTETGYTTHTCTVCGDSHTDGETAALGHDMSAWAVTTAPTCTEAGEETRTCSRCDYSEKRVVDPVVAGDANGDGTTDIRDALTLANALAAKHVLNVLQLAAVDLNGDSVADVLDLKLLVQQLTA